MTENTDKLEKTERTEKTARTFGKTEEIKQEDKIIDYYTEVDEEPKDEVKLNLQEKSQSELYQSESESMLDLGKI